MMSDMKAASGRIMAAMIWDEKGTPGYGLYDRALGAAYLLGLWEAISKTAG